MKYLFTSICLVFIINKSIAQTNLYVRPDAKKYASSTNKIGILPFKTQVKLRPKQLKDITSEQLKDISNNEALFIQNGMYSWFLKRKNRGEFSGDVLSPQITNSILKKSNIDIFDLDKYTPQELGELLGVDCVIMGSFETSKPMSTAEAIGFTLLFGFGANMDSARCSLNFYDTRDGLLVVNYLKKVDGGLGKDSQDLINKIMRKVTRRIPYTN